MNKKINFDALNEAMKSAPMSENKNAENSDKKKKKLIDIPIDWETKIKESYKGTVNGYIQMAIFERMQKDGWIK
jgi:hypothetical protein